MVPRKPEWSLEQQKQYGCQNTRPLRPHPLLADKNDIQERQGIGDAGSDPQHQTKLQQVKKKEGITL